MKLRVVLWLTSFALAWTLMTAPVMAEHAGGPMERARGGQHFGHEDDHHVWRDADWWHHNYPDWMYSHHPEWAAERRDWWWNDHQYHPDWFWAPFWGWYPLWSWGAPYGGAWHDYWWWHQYHPDWMYAHHPEWAEPYGRWMREDHGRHPEWFKSGYWRDHPHDWANPDREFWHREDDRFKQYVQEHPERKYVAGQHGNQPPGQERGGRSPGGGQPNEHRGRTENAPHPAPHPASQMAPHPALQPAPHPAAGGASGGGGEKKK